MKVILLKDVGGVGQHGTIKDVSDGYALNYLIPNGFAKQATPEAIKDFEKQKRMQANVSAEINATVAAKVKEIDGQQFTLKVKANDQGHLFKGIGKGDIAKVMDRVITADMISDFQTIKNVGDYKITVAGAGATATIILKVVGEK